jgi:spore maturation protein SpmA
MLLPAATATTIEATPTAATNTGAATAALVAMTIWRVLYHSHFALIWATVIAFHIDRLRSNSRQITHSSMSSGAASCVTGVIIDRRLYAYDFEDGQTLRQSGIRKALVDITIFPSYFNTTTVGE